MDTFSHSDLRALANQATSPCVTLFLSTHRGGAEEDPVRWKNHLNSAERRLVDTGMREPVAKKFLAPARRLLEEPEFWKHQSDGLAAFIFPQADEKSIEGSRRGEGALHLYRLPVPFSDQCYVASRPHFRPLLPLLVGNGRFFLLTLSQNAVRLLQGNRDRIDEVDLQGTPRSMEVALRSHDRDEPLNLHTRKTSSGEWGAIFSGQGVGIDDKKDDLLRYFRQVDHGLVPILHAQKAPLVLAAVEYLHPIYREANTYDHLLSKGIDGHPDRWSDQELHARAWPLVKPLFEEEQRRAEAQFRQLAGTGNTTSDLETVVSTAVSGRVETLFVASDRPAWGTFDTVLGTVQRHDAPAFDNTDLLELAAAQTLAHGGTVYAGCPGPALGEIEAAAIFRHSLPKHGKRP